MQRSILTATLAASALALGGCAATPFYMGQQPSTNYDRAADHMPETIRSSISTISVHPGERLPDLYVGGDYQAQTPTMGDGAAAGAAEGAKLTGEMIVEDPRALIVAPIILPVAMVAGTIVGAAAAKIQEEVREFRDEMTDDMLDESNPTLPSAALASELESFVGSVDGVQLADPDVADAALTITLTEIAVILDGNDAEMTATAHLVLRDSADGKALYTRSVLYSDSDTLRNWTRDDNALWEEFTVNARRYIAREAAAQLFETITTRHVLRPTDNKWSSRAKTDRPTLSWDFALLGGDSFDGTDIADTPARYDLEIYDGSRIVYAARDIAESRHVVAEPLPTCKRLYWSVRPLMLVEGKRRGGEWMRRATAAERAYQQTGASFSGRKREYMEGFARLTTRCKQ